jgi:predicted CoA-substrate-specific enzyme activase
MGSVSTKVVLMDGPTLIRSFYRRHHGKPVEALLGILAELGDEWVGASVAFTGSSARLAAAAAGVQAVNEVVALAGAVPFCCPEVNSVIEMGGQDSKLLLFRRENGVPVFDDFSMNTVCAAGTGSFLDQQAARLGLRPEELGELALECETPPRIAGRCSVFAKSDMIHLQQIGTPVPHIVAGLCFAVARNFKSSIASGREFRPPVAFTGGVAANPGMVRAFREVLGREYSELIVPPDFRCLTAAGAVLVSKDEDLGLLDPAYSTRLMETGSSRSTAGRLAPLRSFRLPQPPCPEPDPGTGEPVWLGIDVGSISTNLVALDSITGRVMASVYLMTGGRPLEAVKKGLAILASTLGPGREVLGLGTTGSGRYMIGDFTGADVVRNEITAQARAAVEIDPEVDTIFEIGGQDSKYISLQAGRVVDFEMNKVCAAGTGSFLEEQAEKLGLDIREFGPLALDAPSPRALGERCTVFMESDVVSNQADGASLEDLAAGLSYSIVRNYLNRVVGERKIGARVFFQGGTAFNSGVAAAFSAVLGEGRVVIPMNHHVTGAIGAALLAREEMKPGASSFKGFRLAEENYIQDTFVCRGCPNLCEVHRILLQDGRKLFYGGRCEKYETHGRPAPVTGGRNCFRDRERLLLDGYSENPPGANPRVGIPRALWFWEYFPFFRMFFEECGFDVVLSGPSTSELIHSGVESVAAETCFPVKIAHGHVLDLLEKDVGFLFLPSILRNFPNPGFTESYNCPYVEGSPYILDAGLGLSSGEEVAVLSPVLDFSLPGKEWMKGLIAMVSPLGIDRKRAEAACASALAAQDSFASKLLDVGREALASIGPDQPAFVVISRPYNGSDPAVNAELPDKLANMGALVLPPDCLELPLARAAELHGNMYWQYGQMIIAAALLIREDPRLNGVYMTNFGCGPDSFIQHEVARIMGGKPMLTIEIDEHAADAGVITRCEAFMDAIAGRRRTGTSPFVGSLGNREVDPKGRTLWVPTLGDASPVAVAAARKHGVDAVLIPPTTAETVSLGRSVTTGRECYPAIITAGNMLSVLKTNDPSRTAFFMGTASGPCRFGQYCSYHRILLDRLGYEDVPIVTATSSDSYTSVAQLSTLSFQVDMLKALIAGDALKSALCRVRPYEIEPGAADRVMEQSQTAVSRAMEEGRSLLPALREAAGRFSAIPLREGRRPLILMFGEIYVRNDPFAHSNTDRVIESLGGEVLTTPLLEWFEFVNHSFIKRSADRKRLADLLKGYSRKGLMSRLRRRLYEPFTDLLADRPDPSPEEILRAARPYIRENVGGEAILCVGAPMALSGRGLISGAVNIFPFTCLPGTIVSAISKRLRREHSNLPWLNLAFDGQEDTDNGTRLEAFMYQVMQNHSASPSEADSALVEARINGSRSLQERKAER